MLAVTATSIHPDSPLDGLTVGEVAEPEPADGWEVVEVRATSLNHHDLWTLRGVGITEERLPIVLGCDAAGVTADGREVIVHAVIGEGPDETLDERRTLLSEEHDGTFAERVAVPTRNLVDKPPELSFAEAACLPTAWLTAYRMLFTQAQVVPGQRLLVQGAGGGVALAAMLLAKVVGVHVTVATRSAERGERARQLGADEVIEAGGRLSARVDVVIDTVGAPTWSHSLKALVPGGALVVAGATGGADPPADLRRVFFRQLRVLGSTMGTREELVRLVRMMQASGVRPVIDEVVALAGASRAFDRLERGEVFGKIVLEV